MINHDQYSEPIASDDEWDESLRRTAQEHGGRRGPAGVYLAYRAMRRQS
jgi:hypothetical protein